MTFDWAQIAYIGSPLVTPWWAAANVVGGLVIVMWIMAPILCEKTLSDIMGRQSLICIRLQKRALLFIHAHPLILSLRRHWQALRCQQNTHEGLSLRSRGLHEVQQGLLAHYLCLGLRRSICRSFGFSHTYHLLAWPRYLAAVQEVACRRRPRK